MNSHPYYFPPFYPRDAMISWLSLSKEALRQVEERGQQPPGVGASEVQALVAPPEETSMDSGGTKRGGSRQARRRRQLAYPEEATQAAGPAEVSESPAKPQTREGPVI